MKLLQSPEPGTPAQARRIAQESARFNLGRVTRTMNVPDMALEYLQTRHGARIRFETLRNETIEGRPVVVRRFTAALRLLQEAASVVQQAIAARKDEKHIAEFFTRISSSSVGYTRLKTMRSSLPER